MTFDISDAEFEKPRTAFELTTWLQKKFEQMKLTGNFSQIYYERKGLNVKKLIEEAVPLSKLSLYLTTPFQIVSLNLKTGNQNFDAEIETKPIPSFESFKSEKYKVEVSTTETDQTTMRRQALSRQGTVPLVGSIKREKRTIIPEMEFVESSEFENGLISLLYDRFLQKVNTQRYDKNTVILIHLSDFNPISIRSREELIQKTRYFLDMESPEIKGVYFTYQFSNIVDSVEFWQT